MMIANLRNRILLVGVLPVLLASAAVAYLVGSGRMRDLEASHQAQSTVLTQQLQVASQYGLYSGNRSALDSTTSSLMAQPMVLGVALFDPEGRLLAGRGSAFGRSLEQLRQTGYQQDARGQGREVLVSAVYAPPVDVADFYGADAGQNSSPPPLLGYGVLEISRTEVLAQTRAAMAYSTLVGLVVAILGALLALRLGRLVLGPVRLLTDNIRRIGAGDFVTEAPAARDPLQPVHTQLALMADRLAWRRQDLEQQVHVATQALRDQRDEAERANRAKSHFLASASHDLRQPTHAIGLFVASLQQRPLEPQARRIVDYLQQSVDSMQELLDGLLDLSRLDSGTVRVDQQDCAVETVFAAVRSALGPAAGKAEVRLRVRPAPYWTRTDPALLRQVLVNLVQNALRYTDQGTVLLCCRPVRDGTALRIEVRDSGIGIAAEQQALVFQEFYQVGNPGRERGKGMGLGLSIVERLLRLLQHTLVLRSAPGCGSTFAIELPRCAPQALVPPAQPTEADSAAAAGAAVRVLVLEDDPLVQSAITALLAGWSYAVHGVCSFAEAQAWVQQHGAPDLLVCDHRLGDSMNGLQAIAALRQHCGQHFAACLVSGDTDADLMQQAGQAQIPLLHKPIRPAKLRAVLRRLVAGGGVV